MSFDLLVQIGDTPSAPDVTYKRQKVVDGEPKKRKAGKMELRGCEHCPLDKAKGIKKIMGEVTGKRVLVLAQSPGPEENKEGKELVGPSGAWWWKELKRIGLSRADVDVQNAIRCFPADRVEGTYESYLKMRNPSAAETRCCSVHTEAALEKSTASYILVLGQVAAKALLQTRTLPQNKIFWSDQLNAKVYLLDHPSFFLRSYGDQARLEVFRKSLDMFAEDYKKDGAELSDTFAYVKSQDYRLVVNEKQALKAEAIILKYARRGEVVANDIEDATWGDGRRVTATGFCPRPGLSFVFVFKHKDVKPKNGDAVLAVAKRLLENKKIKYAYQYGCSDVYKYRTWEGINPVNFEHDTNLSEYLRFSDKKAYGLVAIAQSRFQDFAGYEQVVTEDMLEGVEVPAKLQNASLAMRYKYVEDHGLFDINKLSLETLRLYNGGDADLTKRIQLDNAKHIPQALMKLYIDLNFVVYKMEGLGPLFDYKHHAKLDVLYPWRAQKLLLKLRKYLRKAVRRKRYSEDELKTTRDADLEWAKKFNPGSPQQVSKALYSLLNLEYPFDDTPNTRKKTLLTLAKESEFAKLLLAWRPDSKAKGILDGYKRSADKYIGRLRTRWWATGTRTGRLSSGASRSKEAGLVNLQNIKKDNLIRNMLVADVRWRRFYVAAIKKSKAYPAVRKYWSALASWDALPKEKQKETKRPAAEGKAAEELKMLGVELERWLIDNIPDLQTYLVFDYGQIEVRVMALMSGDKNLKKDCAESDIHTRVGCIAEGSLVLTDYGLVSIEKVQPYMRVWDGIEFVTHAGVIYQGIQEVMTYDGLSATKDHKVWLATKEESVEFSTAAKTRVRLAVTGVEENPIRYAYDNIPGNTLQEVSTFCMGSMQCVQGYKGDIYRASTKRDVYRMQVSTYLPRQKSASTKFSLSGYKVSLRESRQAILVELWWARYKEYVFDGESFCAVHASLSSASDVQGSVSRSNKQRWTLRTKQYPVSDASSTSSKQKKQSLGGVQRPESNYRGSACATEKRLPHANAKSVQYLASADAGGELEIGSKKVRVYDILNAGPRRRFTVSGKLVSNCTMTGWDADRIANDEETRTLTKNVHFGIMFGLAEKALYAFVSAMSPEDMQGRITQEEVSAAYKRYFKRYKQVKEFQESQRAFAQEHHYVSTLFGMRQPLNVREGESADDNGDDFEAFDDSDNSNDRGSWWGNQAINGPVQGSAHQMLTCALVNVVRQPEKYEVLGIPPMEVHDALDFQVNVLRLPEAFEKGKYLLEEESLKTIASDFPEIKWDVPIVVDAKAGLRLGDQVKYKKGMSVGDFLVSWLYVAKGNENKINNLLKEIAASEVAVAA